ncbi:MAG: hypothetical protein CMM50_12375 [Rhodospirillaceae bacterium]|jgi:hypothetical protein|nr:hypothetical protein [Rhodospirillaceae bacterium]
MNDKTRFINPPNMLKQKVGARPGASAGQIDPEALLRAQAVIDSKAQEYPEWASQEIDKLYVAYQECVNKGGGAANLDKIAGLVHDIRGEGTTYGYPLITKIGTSLYDFTQAIGGADSAQLDVVKAHIDALKVIVMQRMDGDGGQAGAELLNMLRLAVNKFVAAEHEKK